jgi:hypothetical protein
MGSWREALRLDPLPGLLAAGDAALTYLVRRDLVDEEVGPVEILWEVPQAKKLLHKQQADGSWRYPGQNRKRYPETDYDLLETFKSLSQLVAKYGFDRRHPAVERAAAYIFSCQTEEGDIRGILGTQYMPYYHAILTELLIRAGYADDGRIERGLEWLLSVQQDDGGWLIPMQAVPAREKTREMWRADPVPPDRSLPHAHLATGMVLRAFAVHPRYRRREEVRVAGEVLKSRFFQPDKYNDRKAPGYWTKFQYPFWWNNLLTALDSLSLIGFPADDEDVQRGLAWFVDRQEEDGLWRTGYEQVGREETSAREVEARLWVGLAVCRVCKTILPSTF